MVRRLMLLAACASILSAPAAAARAELNLPIVKQQTDTWCWAATASMALRLVGFPDINPAKNYQCGVVAAAFRDCWEDCTQCVVPLQSMDKLVGVLDNYRNLSVPLAKVRRIKRFNPNYEAYPELSRIERSINLSFPVIAGISPDERPEDPAKSQHAVLITGYDDNHVGSGEAWVTVRDPYPYDAGADPYAKAGFPIDRRSGKVSLPWRILRDRINMTSAVFLEVKSA